MGIKTIDIIKIDLVYYMDSKFIEYLQPIYVFSGKFKTSDNRSGDVFFYLPAVDKQLLVD